MPRDDKCSLALCLVALIIVGATLIFLIPTTTLIVLICVIPIVVIRLYLHRTPKSRPAEDTTRRTTPADSEKQQQEETQADTVLTGALPSQMDTRTTRPYLPAQTAASVKQPLPQAEKGRDSVENLQVRINELEERVRWLRERLATGSTTEPTTGSEAEPEDKPPKTSPNEEPEELSERALQKLLEALDEKLTKGAISQQLYQRLRDKYLARLSRARGKREATP